MEKKEQGFIALQLPKDFEEKLKKIASDNCLSVSGVVRLILAQYLNNPSKLSTLGLIIEDEERSKE